MRLARGRHPSQSSPATIRASCARSADLLAPFDLVRGRRGRARIWTEPEETEREFRRQCAAEGARGGEGQSERLSLADDSGLLGAQRSDGDPGIYSARWAGPEKKSFTHAMARVERELAGEGRGPIVRREIRLRAGVGVT